jgi:hypothetical protein
MHNSLNSECGNEASPGKALLGREVLQLFPNFAFTAVALLRNSTRLLQTARTEMLIGRKGWPC